MQAACARPYRGPKTLAAIGSTLLVGGSGLWVAGDRGDSRGLARAGVVTAAIGAAAVIAAGGWMATTAACDADPDCPEDEACREIPAPPGRDPYKQCTKR